LSVAEQEAPTVLKIAIPRRFLFLLEMHPYKVAYGGRNGLKSWSFADAILALGANQRLRIVCGREVMDSLDDSCHKLLKDRIEALGLSTFYRVMQSEIRGRNGTEISYAGLSTQTVESIKSFEGVDIFWVEEGQSVSDNSWNILLPTIRAEGSEVWVSFNPNMDSDPTYVRWVVNPPPGTVVKFSDYRYAKECGFFTDKMEALRVHQKATLPKDEYENIWDGKPRTSVVGAIFANEIAEMVQENRLRPTPYDPRFPVHRIWDLGWNDAMSIIMVQKVAPSALNIINYLEDRFQRYDQLISDMKGLGYNFGDDWLPHDGDQHDPKSGTSAKKMLLGLGCRVKDLPKSDPELRVKAARMMFPRIWIDNSPALQRKTGYLGTARLVDCLKRYKRNIPKTTQEPGSPVHDEYSHAADAFGGLAEIVDQIRNASVLPMVTLPKYRSTERSMGTLG
jgi:phage terminase large subunit